jgi:hypothetical protein
MSWQKNKQRIQHGASSRQIARTALRKIAKHDLCACQTDRRDVPDEAARLADAQPPQACGVCGKTRLIVYTLANPPTIKLAWPAAQQTAENEGGQHGS